jgi:hypothetical protein
MQACTRILVVCSRLYAAGIQVHKGVTFVLLPLLLLLLLQAYAPNSYSAAPQQQQQYSSPQHTLSSSTGGVVERSDSADRCGMRGGVERTWH